MVKSGSGGDSVRVIEFYARTRDDTDDGEVNRLLGDVLKAFGVTARWVDVADAQATRSGLQEESQPPAPKASRAAPRVRRRPPGRDAATNPGTPPEMDAVAEEAVADYPEAEPI